MKTTIYFTLMKIGKLGPWKEWIIPLTSHISFIQKAVRGKIDFCLNHELGIAKEILDLTNCKYIISFAKRSLQSEGNNFCRAPGIGKSATATDIFLFSCLFCYFIIIYFSSAW